MVMANQEPRTVLFVSSTYKGMPMIEEVKNLGLYVLLLTEDQHRIEAWPHDSIMDGCRPIA